MSPIEDPSPVARELLVAFDGSADAVGALDWSIELARRERCPLRVCIARGDLYALSRWADEWTRGLAEEWSALAQGILDAHGSPDAVIEIADGNPAPVVVEHSRAAAMVVLGSRGHGRLGSALLGSVSQQVIRHALSPVVVVRPARDRQSSKICVGVDGSEDSLKALDFAVDLAGCLQMSIAVVHCPEPARQADDERYDDLVRHLHDELRRREAGVRDAVAAAGRRHPDVAIDIDIMVSTAYPADALMDVSNEAAMVIVGSRGRNAFAAMLLGSVSSAVLADAHCTVAVVR